MRELDFKVDKLTNSIENVVTGASLATSLLPLSIQDCKAVMKKNGWRFNWKHELKQPEREVYKLVITNDPEIIQGLISFEIRSDHIFMHLIENAPFNLGRTKKYEGVAGNLVAFVCERSFQYGLEGNLAFESKTRLINHYIDTLGAFHIGAQTMIITTKSALMLINKYFNDETKNKRP